MFLKPHEEGHEKKSTFVSRFHSSFNAAYDSLLNSYKKRVVFFIQKKWLSFGIVAGCIVLLVVLMNVTPTGMVPNEDTGTIMGAVTLPPGTSQERTIEVMNKVDSLIAADPAVKSRTAIIGFSFIGGQGPSYGSFIIKLKDWEERSMMQSSDIVPSRRKHSSSSKKSEAENGFLLTKCGKDAKLYVNNYLNSNTTKR